MNSNILLEEIFAADKKLEKSDLESLKHWYSKQAHLPPISDELLTAILSSCEYNLESAKTTVDNYFTVRSHAPEFFANRNPLVVNIKNGSPISYTAFLNKRAPDGCKVAFLKLADCEPSNFVFPEQAKAFHMLLDLELSLRGPFPGLIVIFDMEGTTFGHVSRISIVHIKKILYYVQEAMPIKLKGIHYINAVSFMDVIMGMIKPFMKKSLQDVLHIHAHGMESLYKFIPKETLPQEYGGQDFTLKELHDKALKMMQNHKNWFEEEAKLRVSESNRIGKSKSSELFGIDGSFKKLNLD